jgi:hypothetical protein
VQVLDTYVTPLLESENPAALPRWRRIVATYINTIAQRNIEFHEMPGVSEVVPQIPDMTPQDQVINDLTQQLQQAQQMLAQMAQQGVDMAGLGGDPAAAEGGPDGFVA